MPQSSVNRLVPFALRASVALVFVVAAVMKIRDPAAFAEQTGNYHFFPELSNAIAVVLPSIEFLCALALLLGPWHWRNAAALTLACMLLVFTVAIARAWALGLNLECGCFGAGSTHVGPWPILRNVGLLSALLIGFGLDPCRGQAGARETLRETAGQDPPSGRQDSR
jgi:uncharacterized membrane protein YphA (DoxX/SURF4 family)